MSFARLVRSTLLCFMLTTLMLAPALTWAREKERVAVLHLKNSAGVKAGEVSYLTQVLRQAANRLSPERYLVMTRHNITELLPPNVELEDCQGECAVETGRNIGAHWVLVGEVLRYGDALRVTLELHDTQSAALRASDTVKGRSASELETALKVAALKLFSRVDHRVDRNSSLAARLAEIDAHTTGAGGSGDGEAWLEAGLHALELSGDEDEYDEYDEYDAYGEADDVEVQSDEDYETELRDLTRLAEERRAHDDRERRSRADHERAVNEQWARVMQINRESASKGVRALQMFIEAYRGHQYGNPRAAEARSALAEARARMLSAKRSRLMKPHMRQVRAAWRRASEMVRRGDARGQLALEAFLEVYADHPLGNPLADEARRVFAEAQAARARGVDPLKMRMGMGRRAPEKTVGIHVGQAGIRWVSIPGGTFKMGLSRAGRAKRPVHEIKIKPFLMAQSEVTVRQYRQCVEAEVCTPPDLGGYCNWGKSGREDHPVDCVDWGQARTFSRWVGGELPTEAQWEYAARSAGARIKYPWGDAAASCAYAVMYDRGPGCGRADAWVVCSKPRGNTRQGLCDMAGSVWEWTLDEWHKVDHQAPRQGERPWGQVARCKGQCEAGPSRRVVRGGSWGNGSRRIHVAFRLRHDAGDRVGNLGFRPCMAISAHPSTR